MSSYGSVLESLLDNESLEITIVTCITISIRFLNPLPYLSLNLNNEVCKDRSILICLKLLDEWHTRSTPIIRNSL